jgi:DUF971 family protein
MNAPTPVGLSLDAEKQLLIEWSDGTRRRYVVRELREKCPCATCREKRNAPEGPQTKNAGVLELLPTGPRPDQVQIEGMSPVGHYAYAVTFSDGHDTGIYPLELLRELGTPA